MPLRISRKKPNSPGARHSINQRAMSRSARPISADHPWPIAASRYTPEATKRAAHANALPAVGTEQPVLGVMG